jgi:hypothetical protein
MHTSWIKVKNPKSPAMLRAEEGQCSLRFLRPARFVAMIVAALAIVMTVIVGCRVPSA